MKTTIEVHGYEIKIDEMNDRIMVSAVKDGETVEEFELDVEAGFEGDDEDEMDGMDAFGEEGDEEEDFGDDEDMDDEDMDEMEEEDMEEEEDDEEGKLESFSHFVKNRKK